MAQCAAAGAGDVNPFGKKGCDASRPLIESAIAAAAAASPDPDFILVTGDFSRHDTSNLGGVSNATAAVQEAIGFVARLIADAFPAQARSNQILHLPSEQFEDGGAGASGGGAEGEAKGRSEGQVKSPPRVVGSLGNNDYPLNYGGVDETAGDAPVPYFQLTQATVAASASASTADADAGPDAHADSFETGGYTATEVTPTLTVINLNTVPYSPNWCT